ncbi:Glycosyl hydrolases family 16 [Verrucomicrobiia bacterium DG1235]|nr:Glycosyl hydrolases family 16 [Verrucomicrobiae bacterium DG1235]
MKTSRTPLFIFLASLLAAIVCRPSTTAEIGEWQLVWSDEFETEGLPNAQWWDYEEGYIRNEEAQYYTVAREENARIENGSLIIEARRDNFEGRPITSASLHSSRSASWTYGKIEVRAQLATGRGTWPAIWMLGDNIGEAGWPGCGEIDIMEYVGYELETVYGTVHTTAYNHVANTEVGGNLQFDDLTETMHSYSIEWSPDEIRFFVDDQNYFTFTNDGTGNDATWPFHRPQHLKLNLAIGGGWGGSQGIDNAIFPARFLIDYVRVYQRKESPPYTIDLQSSGPGNLRVEPEKESYVDGEQITLIADPDIGTRLGKWKNVQVPRALEVPLVVNRSLQIQADFLNPNALNRNTDFSDQLSGWYNWIGGGAAANIAATSQEAALIDVTQSGSEDWHVQFGQGGLPLESGKRYQLQFDASASSGSPSLVAALAMNSEPFTTYTSNVTQLTSSPLTFTLDYTHNTVTNPNTRIEFRLGRAAGSVTLDNVTLRSLDDDALSPYEAWKRDHQIRPINDTGDPDSDGTPNLIEFLLGTDPYQVQAYSPFYSISPSREGPLLSLSEMLLPAAAEHQVSTVEEKSEDLQHWARSENAEPSLKFKRLALRAPAAIAD